MCKIVLAFTNLSLLMQAKIFKFLHYDMQWLQAKYFFIIYAIANLLGQSKKWKRKTILGSLTKKVVIYITGANIWIPYIKLNNASAVVRRSYVCYPPVIFFS
jgi:hypothetical protein